MWWYRNCFNWLITNLSKALVRRGDRFSRMPTRGFRSSGESTFGVGTPVTSRRVGRTFLTGLGKSCDVTMTSRTGDLTSAADTEVWSTVPGEAVPQSAKVLSCFSSIDAIREDDAETLGCCGEFVINLLSGRLNERRASPRKAATPTVMRFSIKNWNYLITFVNITTTNLCMAVYPGQPGLVVKKTLTHSLTHYFGGYYTTSKYFPPLTIVHRILLDYSSGPTVFFNNPEPVFVGLPLCYCVNEK